MLAATRICRAPRLASHSRECPSMPLTFSPVTSEDEWLEICTLRSVGTGGGRPPPVTRRHREVPSAIPMETNRSRLLVRLSDFSLELEENRPAGAVLLRQFRPISQVHSAVVVLLAPAG